MRLQTRFKGMRWCSLCGPSLTGTTYNTTTTRRSNNQLKTHHQKKRNENKSFSILLQLLWKHCTWFQHPPALARIFSELPPLVQRTSSFLWFVCFLVNADALSIWIISDSRGVTDASVQCYLNNMEHFGKKNQKEAKQRWHVLFKPEESVRSWSLKSVLKQTVEKLN